MKGHLNAKYTQEGIPSTRTNMSCHVGCASLVKQTLLKKHLSNPTEQILTFIACFHLSFSQ